MRDFTANEILKLTEKHIDDLIISNTFEFETNSKDIDKEYKFNALVLNQTLEINGKPFALKIKIEGEKEEKNLNIIKIKSMKQLQ